MVKTRQWHGSVSDEHHRNCALTRERSEELASPRRGEGWGNGGNYLIQQLDERVASTLIRLRARRSSCGL